jgi:hypothetical protein
MLPTHERVASITFSSPTVGKPNFFDGFYLKAIFRIFNNSDPVVKGTIGVGMYSLFEPASDRYVLNVYNHDEFTEFLDGLRPSNMNLKDLKEKNKPSFGDYKTFIQGCVNAEAHSFYYLIVLREGRLMRILHTM